MNFIIKKILSVWPTPDLYVPMFCYFGLMLVFIVLFVIGCVFSDTAWWQAMFPREIVR